MQKSDIWLPLIASIGVGAATFYTMSRSDKPISKAVENVSPILSNMTSNQNSQQ